MTSQIRAELIPWDDAEFVREYERAREQVAQRGPDDLRAEGSCTGRAPPASRGYPHAVVEVDRTVDEALAHAARWTVRRDGLGGD